jgi:hypothetical protein
MANLIADERTSLTVPQRISYVKTVAARWPLHERRSV